MTKKISFGGRILMINQRSGHHFTLFQDCYDSSQEFPEGTDIQNVISSVFGGAQINFAQADFEGTAIIDGSIIFGGVDIIIPSNWNLKNEMSVVFGGIEDRRTVTPNVSEAGKTLILKGNIMFGGMEIKSY